MRHILLILALALPLSAQSVTVENRVVPLDTTVSTQRTLYTTLLAMRAAHVDSVSTVHVDMLDSAYEAVLDSTGITLQPDRLDDAYVRLSIPQNDRLLIAARGQWLADGAESVGGDTVRADIDLAGRGLLRLEPFWGIAHEEPE